MTLSWATRRGMSGFVRRIAVVTGVVLLSAALLWPAYLNDGPLTFFDTLGYLDQGRSGVALVTGKIMAVLYPATTSIAEIVGDAARDTSFLRSIVYPAFAYIGTLGPMGFTGTVFLHSLIVVVLMAMIAGREAAASPRLALALVAVCATLTALPWTVSTLMPDVFAAVAILCAIIVASRLDRIGLGGKLFVFCAASLATLSHYGHPPLFLAAAVAALVALALMRQLSVWAIVLTLGPLVATLVASFGVAQVVFDEASVVPRRMPLLLARSMEDGPALWHLEAHCDEYGYAVCELWDGQIPSDLGTLLWSSDGLLKKATDAQMDRIRQEEILILKRAFIEFPAEQTWSFVGNAVLQIGMIGLGDTSWGRMTDDGGSQFQREPAPPPRGFENLDAITTVQQAVVLAAAGLIGLFLLRDGLRTGDRERAILFVALVGLVANATIFGGLSAPVDRYQMRVIWIVPLIAALFWLGRQGGARVSGGADV